jgi:hypothetical protein
MKYLQTIMTLYNVQCQTGSQHMSGEELTIPTMTHFSDHARKRMAQRSVSKAQIDYVLGHGKEYNRAGATWFVLRWKDLPKADRAVGLYEKAVGLVVCMADDSVLTVYKRERPSIHVRKKEKRDQRPQLCGHVPASI